MPVTYCVLFVFIISLYSVQCKLDLRYDSKRAYVETESGLECINNCVDNKCFLDTTSQLYSCNESNEDALVYSVYKRKQNCLSRCTGGWCYISNDRVYDFCNSETTVSRAKNVYFTLSNGPCKNTCKYYYTNFFGKQYYKCDHYWGNWDYCNPNRSYDFIKAKTERGKVCVQQCLDYKDEGYRWCYYDNNDNTTNWNYCAYPALPKTRRYTIAEIISKITYKKDQIKPENTDDVEEQLRLRRLQLDTSIINSIAQDIELDSVNYNTVHIHEADNPINQFTVRGYTLERIPPVVIRATIRHTRSSKERLNLLSIFGKMNKDDAGNVVAYSFFGPDEFYNLFPENYRVNRGEYKVQENDIRNFLQKHPNGHVKMLVVLLYDANNLHPDCIAMLNLFYDANNVVHDQFYYFFYNQIIGKNNQFSTKPQPPNLSLLGHVAGRSD